ncbi:hypothetical protein [Pseudoduganella namucuonensis]|uniref:Uncharacterized protein n=1 Tax=Pseudoduganella namucuonensis TaxID=1035707 RepID=A0A1I7M470_9BURK|nr:hypothetical protein [Pseudoduganella namucuonensis]SFV16724.1 hypothetical protein SAMN05216552_10552 [Pseudoduganella namucuonensis]
MTTAFFPLDQTPQLASRDLAATLPDAHDGPTVVTRVWQEEYNWLEAHYNDAANCSPKLRFPDLISACVSLVFDGPAPERRIFTFLHQHLVLRDQQTTRRREEMWREQYALLLALQKSEQNRHPHPQFKLDHFTTACVALVMAEGGAKAKLFEQGRHNIARRAAQSSV